MNKVWWCDSIPLTTCLDKICKYHAWVSVKDFSMGIVMLLQTFRQSCLSSKDYVHQQSRVGHLHQYIGKGPALFEGCKRALATVRAGGDPVWQSLVIKYNKSDSHFQNRRQFQSDVIFPWKLHAFSRHVDLEWSSDAWHFFVAEIACHAEEDWWGDTVAEHFFRRAFLSRNFLPKKKRCSFSSDETIQVVSKLAEYVCDKDRLPVDLWRGCEVNCGATAAAWHLRMIPGVPWHQAILLVGERLSYNPWGSLVSFFQPFLLIEAWDLRNEACPFAASFQDGL